MPYVKESVATMGWKAIKATISGVSIMKQLVPHEDTIDQLPDSVFESTTHDDPGKFRVKFFYKNIMSVLLFFRLWLHIV